MSWPAAEVDIDEPLVRDLLEQQHPDLAGLILHEVGFGFDNSLWRLGSDLLLAPATPDGRRTRRKRATLAAALPDRCRYRRQ